MDIFEQHEIFEIEVLDQLSRSKIIEPLVFGGGTMLRLCHELNRYSADLDFWLIKKVQEDAYFRKIEQSLGNAYELTDAQIKHYTLVFELRSPSYPKRLKIEIRKAIKDCDYQDKIAYSRFSTLQVLLRAHTLEQTMENKVAAFLDRAEIRDAFDLEFLLRRGIDLPPMNAASMLAFQQRLHKFKELDFKVKLGSILDSEMRNYYIARKFAYLEEKLLARINAPSAG
jgi:predicted nucleotidyltransferase component of viral defense system